MARTYHLVINPKALEFYADIKNYLLSLKTLHYLYVVEHIGQEEKHYHVLCQFRENIKKLSTKKLHGAHIKPMIFGNTDQLKDYLDCKDKEHIKNNVTSIVIDESGEYKCYGTNNLPDNSCKSLLGVKRMADLPDWRMVNAWKTLKINERCKINVANWNKHIEVYWIQGPSGIGKSEKAWELIKTWYQDHLIDDEEQMTFDEIKYNSHSGFYLGIDLEEENKVAIFDDFRARMLPEEFINLIDYRRHKLEIKGGHIVNNYELIIFTTIQHFDRIYSNVENYEMREQWTRRVKVIDLYNKSSISLDTLTSRDYEHDYECYYCDNNIQCKCKCIVNNCKCKEKQCNCDFFNKD